MPLDFRPLLVANYQQLTNLDGRGGGDVVVTVHEDLRLDDGYETRLLNGARITRKPPRVLLNIAPDKNTHARKRYTVGGRQSLRRQNISHLLFEMRRRVVTFAQNNDREPRVPTGGSFVYPPYRPPLRMPETTKPFLCTRTKLKCTHKNTPSCAAQTSRRHTSTIVYYTTMPI